MKMLQVLSLLCVSVVMQSHGMMDPFQMMQEMEYMFDQCVTRMNCNFCATSAPHYTVEMHDKNESVEICLNLGKQIASDAISIEVEDAVLYVNVVSGNDQINLKIADQCLMMSTSIKQTKENSVRDGDKQQSAMSAMSVSQMSQMMTLPASVDINRQSPKADLIDGVLMLTLAKKSAYKVPVNVSQTAAAPENASQLMSTEKEEEFDK